MDPVWLTVTYICLCTVFGHFSATEEANVMKLWQRPSVDKAQTLHYLTLDQKMLLTSGLDELWANHLPPKVLFFRDIRCKLEMSRGNCLSYFWVSYTLRFAIPWVTDFPVLERQNKSKINYRLYICHLIISHFKTWALFGCQQIISTSHIDLTMCSNLCNIYVVRSTPMWMTFYGNSARLNVEIRGVLALSANLLCDL